MKTAKTTSKKKVLLDCHVEADLSGMLWCRHYPDPEKHAEALEVACNELVDFLKDHRSQDRVYLDVVHDYEDQCEACSGKWETMSENEDGSGKTLCANCGIEVDEL